MRTISVQNESGNSIAIKSFPIDEVGANERADFFTKRSLKKDTKLSALYLAMSMCDLTTLEGMDTPGRVKQMCAKAKAPVPPDLIVPLLEKKGLPHIPPVAAVCVYPSMVPHAVEALDGTGILVASVSTAFPSGQAPLQVKIDDTAFAVENGASEIDMVINRGAFLSGDYVILGINIEFNLTDRLHQVLILGKKQWVLNPGIASDPSTVDPTSDEGDFNDLTQNTSSITQKDAGVLNNSVF